MNRLLSILGLAAVAPGSPTCGSASGGAEVATTVYVGRHFEMREHDQPVKYVFHGGVRVAHITGSLSANVRLQRWRLQTGWNLVSLAVTATNLDGQLRQFANGPGPLVQALYRWQPDAANYRPVLGGETIQAGSVLWLRARTNAVVTVAGSYSDPAIPLLPPGGGYLASGGFQSWTPTLPGGITIWWYEAGAGVWRMSPGGELTGLGDLPPTLAPGETWFVQADEAIDLASPPSAPSVLYYHPDHLGSTAAVTDRDGAVVDESVYYPFGGLRRSERVSGIEPRYGFANKEVDRESGLADFGYRMLHPTLARWLNPDPKGESGGGMNPYAYVNNNPLKFEDPNGADITANRKVSHENLTVHYHIHLKAVLIDMQSTKFDPNDVARYAQKIKDQIEKKSFQGSYTTKQRIEDRLATWKFSWSTSVDIRVVDKWGDIKSNEHVFRIVDGTKDNARGEANTGGMLIDLARDIFPSKSGRTMEETAAHEFGHTGSLGHDNRSDNLMKEGGIRPAGADKVDLYKIQSIFNASEARELNKRDQTMKDLDSYEKRDRR